MLKIIGFFTLALIVVLTGIRLYHNAEKKDAVVQEEGVRNSSLTSMQALAQCVVRAAGVYHIPPDVLIGIMYVEGGRMGQAVGPNDNGTYDLGIMQINSVWVPKLALLWNVDYLTAYYAVRDIGCENVYVGAWILSQGIAQAGSLHEGIGYYHSATPGLGSAYADKVTLAMKNKGLY